ncbi:hypothetical protein Q670_14445 [Alcanivorax sp. P2S70]|uniref:DUF2269 domain-containing protein n=1 Tax=Alcanivorax profundi TaxID=2338368 RepID=A0A418Y091_9GAMM|nr:MULTISPECIES: hypothetical protein [Alcanivorax]ERP90094.1 hypothetical protein Q670_14445 [Alcanivorax sp. P2S70]RJG18708.1 hypothetical protein D4A39_09640 [Alcanivorax profundi]
MEELRQLLLPWYLQIKFVHLLFVMIWSFSTAVAYTWYVKSAWLAWQRTPDDPHRLERRNWTMEQFDRGASLEHIAFPIVLATGALMVWLTGWGMDSHWLMVKLAIVIGIFIPVEVFDYWISHFGGSKKQWRLKGDMKRYEKLMQWHWLFFRISTPLVMIFIPMIIYLAVTKPGF